MILIETWVDKKGWDRIKQSWKKSFVWELLEARVQKKKRKSERRNVGWCERENRNE